MYDILSGPVPRGNPARWTPTPKTMIRFVPTLLLFVPLATLLSGCGGDPPSAEERFENLTLPVLALDGAVATLHDRRADAPEGAGSLLLDDLHLVGDLFGDGTRVAVGVLYLTREGRPTSAELVVGVEESDGGIVHSASHSLGNGIRLEGLRFDAGTLLVYLLTPAPDDPPCCPSRSELRRFRFMGGELVAVEVDGDEGVDVAGDDPDSGRP